MIFGKIQIINRFHTTHPANSIKLDLKMQSAAVFRRASALQTIRSAKPHPIAQRYFSVTTRSYGDKAAPSRPEAQGQNSRLPMWVDVGVEKVAVLLADLVFAGSWSEASLQ